MDNPDRHFDDACDWLEIYKFRLHNIFGLEDFEKIDIPEVVNLVRGKNVMFYPIKGGFVFRDSNKIYKISLDGNLIEFDLRIPIRYNIVSVSDRNIVLGRSKYKFLYYLDNDNQVYRRTKLKGYRSLYFDNEGHLYMVDKEGCLYVLNLETDELYQVNNTLTYDDEPSEKTSCFYDFIIAVAGNKVITDNDNKPQYIKLLDLNKNYDDEEYVDSNIFVSDEGDLLVESNGNIIIAYNNERWSSMEQIESQFIDVYDINDGNTYDIDLSDYFDTLAYLTPSIMTTNDILISGIDENDKPISYIYLNSTGEIVEIPIPDEFTGQNIVKCQYIGNKFSPVVLAVLSIPNPIPQDDPVIYGIYLLKY